MASVPLSAVIQSIERLPVAEPTALPPPPTLPTDEYAGVVLQPLTARKTSPAAPVGEGAVRAREARERQADALQAQEIMAEMAVERRRSREKIRALWADLETDLFKMWEEVMLARQKVMDDLFEKWCKLLLE